MAPKSPAPSHVSAHGVTPHPATTAIAVSSMGRKRTAPASTTASSRLAPSRRRISMKSTRMMEFRTTIPAPAMNPIMDVAVKKAPARAWAGMMPMSESGMGIMMAYGSYLGEDVNLLRTARTVVIMDTVFALCAGLAIFPIVFANGLDPAAGPGLVFVTLPLAFGNISGGLILGTLFFLLLTFAALTSSISLLEPVVELLEERTPMNRVTSTIVAGVTIWALGIAALLSFNLWGDVQLAGLNIFDLLDYATSKFMLPLAGLGAIVFAAWKLDQQGVKAELGLGSTGFGLWTLLSRYVAPIGVLFVFWSNL